MTETSSRLDIVAAGHDGAEVGRVTVRSGQFVMEEDGRLVDGKQMEVVTAGHTARHESEGHQLLQLPLFPADQDALNTLLLDARVRDALARWDITFDAERPSAIDPSTVVSGQPEDPYHACNPAPSGTCNATSCIQANAQRQYDDGNCILGKEQLVCCGGTKNAARRRCGFGAANTCGTEGTNGCAVCWTAAYTTSCTTSHYTPPTNFVCTEQGGAQYSFSYDIQISYN